MPKKSEKENLQIQTGKSTNAQHGFAKMGAEVVNSTFEIIMDICAIFEHLYFKFPHFGKPRTVSRHYIEAGARII